MLTLMSKYAVRLLAISLQRNEQKKVKIFRVLLYGFIMLKSHCIFTSIRFILTLRMIVYA